MSEPSLHELQRWMKSRIRSGEHASAAAIDAIVLNPQRGTPGEERLSVYAGGYVARMREALAEVYEAVHHVLGEQAFAEVTEGYARRHPSHDYNLSLAGRHLPEFLLSWPLTQQLPFLPELATLEWLVRQAFHAFDAPPLDAKRLAGLSLVDWDRARLVFQNSVGVFASAWPVLDIWESRTRPRNEVNIEVVNRPQRVFVFRRGLQTRCELLDARQFELLEGLLAGRTLGNVCGKLASKTGDTPLPLTEWFARWAQLGLIIRCELLSGR